MLAVSIRVVAVTAAILMAAGSVARSQELPAPEGWAALERGDGSRAAAIFRDALDRAPYNPVLHYGSAQASLALGRTDAAISSLKRAVQHDPTFVQALVLLAQVAYGAADLDLALSRGRAEPAAVADDQPVLEHEEGARGVAVVGERAQRVAIDAQQIGFGNRGGAGSSHPSMIAINRRRRRPRPSAARR